MVRLPVLALYRLASPPLSKPCATFCFSRNRPALADNMQDLRVGNKYRIGRKIGSGSFGDIYLGAFSKELRGGNPQLTVACRDKHHLGRGNCHQA